MEFLRKQQNKWYASDINLRIFLIGILLLGINSGILTTTFNNYLNDIFKLGETERGFLEFPRELPGALLIVVTGILSIWLMRTWAILVGIISAIGVIGLGFLSPTIGIMTAWMILWSLGDHLFMPVESAIGLHLAHAGKQGARLGQISGARNLSAIAGAGLVWIIAQTFSGKEMYQILYAVAGIIGLIAAFTFSRIHNDTDKIPDKKKFVLKKKYTLYYILNILFGARKQLFLTFGPWVLITVYHTKPATIAILIMIASLAGVIFRQVFGYFVDKFGEQKLFIADSIILLIVCAGYIFSVDVYVLYTLFIIDNLMFATRIARTTYLSKISKDKRDIPATLSMGITMDHIVSMTVPVAGGLLWHQFGYQSVFMAASIVAVLGLFAALNTNRTIREIQGSHE